MININYSRQRDWLRIVPNGYFRQLPPVGVGESTMPVNIPRREVLLGDALEQLKTLPTSSVDCVITSPPYFQLRDYAVKGQMGLEPTVDDWVTSMRSVFFELARVLKPAGSLWLNLGDSFSRHDRYGAPSKGMFCAPERLLLALAGDGWIVRSKVIWSKTNTMPNSVSDRLNVTYEVVYFLVRSPRYFFDLNAIREPYRFSAKRSAAEIGSLSGKNDGLLHARDAEQPGHILGKNPGDVWRIATKGFRGQHFATFPPELIRRPLLASCPEAVCVKCGTPWKRAVRTWKVPVSDGSKHPHPKDSHVMRFGKLWNTLRVVGDLVPCLCSAPTVPGVVLDPFFGAGTIGVVAEQLHRDWLGIEISATYRDLALGRIVRERKLKDEVPDAA